MAIAKSKKAPVKEVGNPVTAIVADDFFSTFFSKFPFGDLVVFGENVISAFFPQWEEIKKEIVYFITYAEYSAKHENANGKDKKEAVVNFVWQSIERFIPVWVPDFFVKSIIGMIIDHAVDILNKSFPNWENEISKYFDNKVA